jgi:hypothetical protein
MGNNSSMEPPIIANSIASVSPVAFALGSFTAPRACWRASIETLGGHVEGSDGALRPERGDFSGRFKRQREWRERHGCHATADNAVVHVIDEVILPQ